METKKILLQSIPSPIERLEFHDFESVRLEHDVELVHRLRPNFRYGRLWELTQEFTDLTSLEIFHRCHNRDFAALSLKVKGLKSFKVWLWNNGTEFVNSDEFKALLKANRGLSTLSLQFEQTKKYIVDLSLLLPHCHAVQNLALARCKVNFYYFLYFYSFLYFYYFNIFFFFFFYLKF
jgi:hypothetical protein